MAEPFLLQSSELHVLCPLNPADHFADFPSETHRKGRKKFALRDGSQHFNFLEVGGLNVHTWVLIIQYHSTSSSIFQTCFLLDFSRDRFCLGLGFEVDIHLDTLNMSWVGTVFSDHQRIQWTHRVHAGCWPLWIWTHDEPLGLHVNLMKWLLYVVLALLQKGRVF